LDISNPGGFAETFNVTILANTTIITVVASVNMVPGNVIVQNVTWNTTGFSYGNYTLKAAADIVQGETNTVNNNLTDGLVTVAGLGDLTGKTPNALDFVPDGKVDIVDVAVVAKFFGHKAPPAPVNCDVSGTKVGAPDGKIDITDVATVARQFGQKYSY
jgi:hypothetical protein